MESIAQVGVPAQPMWGMGTEANLALRRFAGPHPRFPGHRPAAIGVIIDAEPSGAHTRPGHDIADGHQGAGRTPFGT